MSESIDINQIFELLPHRYPFLLVDRVVTYTPFESLVAIKNVTINEPFFVGHFPGNPVMPGVMMVEALAQASAILSSISRQPRPGYRWLYLLAGVDNAKFKHVVLPGDTLELRVSLSNQRRDFWRMHGEAYVGDKLACSVDLISASKEVEA